MPDRFAIAQSEVLSMRLPIILSLAGHIVILILLILFMAEPSPPPQPLEKSGIAVAFAPFAVQPQAALAPPEPVQPLAPSDAASAPPEETVPLPPPQAPSAAALQVPMVPPREAVTAETPPPPSPKPVVKPKPKFVVRRQETPQPPLPVPPRYAPVSLSAIAAKAYAAGPSAAALVASVPGPDLSVNYRALISAWFESHKRYPETARERGEEGSVGLRFRVDRFGRVIDYALLNSTGYPDLDQSVEEMMNGAQLPPFPPGMKVTEIEVSVRIGFNLTR